jgi:hypothetical protein
VSFIAGLDHAIIAAGDLAEAVATMRRLGFLTTPPAAHSDHMGTENTTLVFRDRTYVELMAVRRETPANARLRAEIAAGQALFGLVLATGNAAAAAAAFHDSGVSDEAGMQEFSRPVETPEGPRDAAFRTAHVAEAAGAGPMVFACEHRTPELVWRPEFMDHPNGVVGIERIVGVARDREAAARAWARIAPDADQDVAEEALTIHLGGVQLAFLAPELYAAIYGPPPASEPGLGALVFRTADLARTRAALSAAAAIRETEAGLEIGPQDALGAPMVFVP